MAKPLQVQLLDAFEERQRTDGLTWEDLTRLVAPELGLTVDSVSRKLRGLQGLRAPEVEVFAKALRVEVSTGKPRRVAA